MKNEKILSETTRPKALIFGLWHNLVDLYQVRYAPWGQNALPGVNMFFIGVYRENVKKSCLKPEDQ